MSKLDQIRALGEAKLKSSDVARVSPARKPKSAPQSVPKISAATSVTTTYQYRKPEERKAYMAKYMRDRRARLRAEREKKNVVT